ncbi:YsnF/AvaK domain-containing protein [Rathayibacter iranicus]|uniref:DUF2382 domain-containing protein n=2 Tax=Rathayibacter iranicus TaxID=59737 RepID=A0AAD1AC44_9MICO|nr:YsnF/AvaK domain-containing protein [Rathayibacter iranicus]AZZ55517.1 DUF2382 domain-containing protein [Rathayibacter iranicus]MWV31651.1 DUF2382 domain-containing protein [Rathayibacter iranicus NCPPB 2253 = VKM Ac-1602]PPI48306.1 hypothetical protein C5E09_05270 [Rathayibacter iranicus]PPI60937.1 hypothetical protein C5E08_06175 [Rathayibacter iranicus]PPI72534.1 hypothetical protein C5E01_04440 [Rathayibacter iranicus]
MSTTESAEPGQEPITVVRSEERLDVRTVYTPTERLHIRKVIVTEERTVTVTLRREELVLEREPLGASLDGGELGSSEESPEPVTFVLHAEEPVLTTRVVPVERVHVAIDRIVAMQSMTETVRKERVDIRTEPQILDDNAE